MREALGEEPGGDGPEPPSDLTALLAIGRRIGERAGPGTVILCMLPDTGERYLSTPLFPFAANMYGEELAISRSTRGYQVAGREGRIPLKKTRLK